MSLRKRSIRTIAAGSVLGLTAGTAAVVGLAAPASAAAGDLACELPVLGAATFPADISSSAKTVAGKSVRPAVTGSFVIPDATADLMRDLLGTTQMSGSIAGTYKVGSKSVTSQLTIPQVEIPTDGDVPLAANGKLPAVTPKVGSTPILAEAQNLTVLLHPATGDPTEFAIPCTPASEFQVGTIEAVKATSKARVGVKYAKKSDKAAVTAKFSSNGAPATGKVQILIKKGKKTVGKKMVALKKQTAKATFKIKKKGKYTAIATYKGNANVKGSSAKKTFTAR